MKYACVAVPAAPVRRKAGHREEMVNQLLFGEAVLVLKEKGPLWRKIRSLHDGYEGWMTRTLLEAVTAAAAEVPATITVSGLLQPISMDGKSMFLPAGASLPRFSGNRGMLGDKAFEYNGPFIEQGKREPSAAWVTELATGWLNAPYLWGGRTPLGTDCSGFTQVIFKQMGIALPRDAWQQAQEGKPVKKFSQALPGDLAFFDNKEDIVHVGIMLEGQQLIHASGRVRIDPINKKGISSRDTGSPNTRLRAIRRYW